MCWITVDHTIQVSTEELLSKLVLNPHHSHIHLCAKNYHLSETAKQVFR